MNYKALIKDQSLRFAILNLFRWVPDSIMISIQYKIKMGFWPNFKYPKRYTEKIQLYKIRYRNPIMHQCVDKYEVHQYVKSKGLGEILNEIYGIYDNANDIDFDKLPEKFVIKTTSGGGGNNIIIVTNKYLCDFNEIRAKLSLWLTESASQINAGREWAYSGIKQTRIIIERYIQTKTDLIDYKFFCFNGVVQYIQVDLGRFGQHSQRYYTKHWEPLNVHCSYPIGKKINIPTNFDKMITIAEDLSKTFPFVRTDMYNVEGKIIFGELTFYPSSGYGKFHPDNFDFELGSYFTEYQ